MKPSLQSPGLRTPANPHHSDLDDIRAGKSNLRIDAKELPNPAGYGPCRSVVREAMRRGGITNKIVAICSKQPESVISEALGGTRSLNLEWWWSLDGDHGQAFWLHFADVITEARELSRQAAEDEYDNEIGRLVSTILRHGRKARRTA